VLLYTGLRRGDAVRLGRQHVRDGVATIRTEKTGVTVSIPILSALGEILQAGPCGDRAFICGENSGPFTKESFGNVFREACNAPAWRSPRTACAGSARRGPRTTAPPLRSWKLSSAGRAGGMASLYTRAADRARLAKGAMAKLDRTPGEPSIPAPSGKVREASRKDI
jgi:integrase